MEPTQDNNPPTPQDQTLPTPDHNRRVEAEPDAASQPELTHQIDQLMATSAAPSVIAPPASHELPETPQTFPPSVVAPQQDAAHSEPSAVDPVSPALVAPVAPVAAEIAAPAAVQPVMAPAIPAKAGRSWKKPALLAAVIVVILGGASAAAYVGFILPNQPQYVLLEAFDNSLQQKQVSYKGSVDSESDGTAIKVALTGAQDATKHASDINLNLTTSGITLPLEARLVDKNAYVKFGDLSPISSLISLYAGDESGKLATTVNQQLSNKWISIDSTLLKSAGVDCYLNSDVSLTKADMNMLKLKYIQNPFVTIDASAGDTVNGQNVEKYSLTLDDDKALKYANSLDNLSFAKALTACDKSATTKAANRGPGDHKKTPLTIWVNKKTKQIVQLGADITRSANKTSAKITFTYEPVSISAPTDSTPALEVLAKLEKSLGVPANSGTSTGGNASGLTGLLSGLGASAKLRP
jgi:hypothetical protein